ncbi:hypothetical protein PSN45_005184 [Yamadazyma tenuis]|uniref:Protein YIP n=1 Tax=Candida tenuis (strain ATCC 10573 / BCRC 21748 / CBS 615 / JCM 9827 / NBRC 10315 / NRRL Y-1498 / VKM Y-70) TaxID=590646 RepID=G3B0Y1_CANTC|nr:uncharacterized protein CANTEDRAFT_93067 [Yamadazyma tenuis ATCC 10573]EGV64834.1 hypothetical protein CANTEDRAFT_93067 [Yamadazyma tenuis ATCC 10573]WEJ97628.1 hypothetical protein PSN45_005184 [Yamadazyma tenuis]
MSGSWNQPSYSENDIDDFIIPDEEVPVTSKPQASPKSTPQATASGPSQNASDTMFSSIPWNMKVDLSSTFTPFTTSNAFNNTVREHQYTGGDTLDEPVLTTLSRDLLKIWKRLTIVIWPIQLAKLAKRQQSKLVDFAQRNGVNIPESIIRERRISVGNEEDLENINTFENIELNNLDWDLWGPLIFSLVYSVVLGMSSSTKQTNSVFSGSFSFMWIFYVIIGLNIQLLGGNISFMSAISAVGYSMFPITIGEVLCSLLISWKLVRLALMLVLCCWSIYSGVLSLKCSGVLPGRVLLAVYPVALMYAVLSWLTVIT